VALSLGGLLGCLDDPPEYVDAARIPPVVNFSQVVPPLSVVHQIDSTSDSIHVNVPFRSEDLEDEVLAVFMLDAVPGKVPLVVHDERLHPSDFDDLSRSIDAEIREFGDPGCHTLTLLLTHSPSNPPNFRFEVQDETLATRLVWWISVRPAAGDVLLSECPTQGQQTGQGSEP
jgi:hypothetical protein